MAARFDKGLFLLSEFLRARLDGLVKIEDLGSEVYGTLADEQQVVDRCDEFLMRGVADALDLGFAVAGELGEGAQELRGLVAIAVFADERDELVEIVRV